MSAGVGFIADGQGRPERRGSATPRACRAFRRASTEWAEPIARDGAKLVAQVLQANRRLSGLRPCSWLGADRGQSWLWIRLVATRRPG